jgi:hypothetical protein
LVKAFGVAVARTDDQENTCAAAAQGEGRIDRRNG